MSAKTGFALGFALSAGTLLLWSNLPTGSAPQSQSQVTQLPGPQAAMPFQHNALQSQEIVAATESGAADIPDTTNTELIKAATAVADSLESVPDVQALWRRYQQVSGERETTGEFPWRNCFKRAAASYDLPEALLLAIARGESNFDPAARSSKEAIGLMQIQWPVTSRHLGVRREGDLYKPCTNVDAGARYLRELIDLYDNDWHLAVAAYNYGPNRISASEIPEGARWYSHYIYKHLLTVLGQVPAPQQTAALPASTPANRQLLMSFNQPYRAQAFMDYLRDELPQLSLVSAREPLGTHAVYLLYNSAEEHRQALQSLAFSGVPIKAAATTSNLSF